MRAEVFAVLREVPLDRVVGAASVAGTEMEQHDYD